MAKPTLMGYGEHLEELRRRIIIVLCAAAVPFFVTFMFLRYQALKIALWPMLSRAPEAIPATHRPEELILVAAKIALVAGIVVASPVVIYQLWAFVSPGLKENERKAVRPLLLGAMLLFATGVAVCYCLVLPFVFEFFVEMNAKANLQVIWSVDKVVGTTIMMMLAFGVGFELPVVIVFLTKIGLVTPQTLVSRRKYAVLIIALVSALITPSDYFSMIVMAGPLYILYEFSIILARISHKKRLAKMQG
ncbi:MAG: twin-arginine translocase subunit TatC [Planctomycetes bacterium]|nr:twin-arginine translocase subunit TatC [Planctomycetota bacterium]